MNPELTQLVDDAIRLTGETPPSLMDESGPALGDKALSATGFYLVGLIGGKEVGKSSLVNALVGQPISKATSHGPGTDQVIAYAHEAQLPALTSLLESEVRGQYRIIPHRLDSLARQVLVDLPDIDSHYESHLELTRKMLRHILFPLWVQSVEKYADRQPQQLLATVAAGNAATNFLFCLNKADQLDAMTGGSPTAAVELRDDFSQRIARSLSIDPPRVWLLSAANPLAYDLPELLSVLSQEKSSETVHQSQSLAKQQQDRSVLSWVNTLDLPGKSQRIFRLEEEAAELVAGRITAPLLERSLPGLADDPSSRLALTDEVLSARVSHWPVVNLVHVVLTPVLAVVRRNVGATRTASLPDAEALVDAHLRPGGTTVASLIKTTFALLQQSSPQISQLYQQQRLWEEMPADTAAVNLRALLTDTVEQQRKGVRKKLAGRSTAIFAPLRWLLTIGALIWFPFAQPILESLLAQNQLHWSIIHQTHELVVLTVRIFSVNQLLQNLTFLSMYFFILWVILRWDTQRQINRFVARWKSDSSELSLMAVTVQWTQSLLNPIRRQRSLVDDLIQRSAKVLPQAQAVAA